jgi:hypothetical protein
MRRKSRTPLLVVVLVVGAVTIGLVAAAAQGSARNDPSKSVGVAGKSAATKVAAGLTTTTYTFSTATNVINCGLNEGWWSLNETSSDCNTNYITGNDTNFSFTDRGYATFDVSGVANPCMPSSATLSVDAALGSYAEYGSGPTSLTLGLFDVATDPVALSEKDNNPDATIYTDLGTGTMVGGPYVLPTTTDFGTTFHLTLNAAGRNMIYAAKQNHVQYVSFGMGLINPPAGTAWLFGDSGSESMTLAVNYPKLCKVT